MESQPKKMNRSMLLNQCLEALALVLEYNMKAPAHQHAIRVGEGSALIAEKIGLSPASIQKIYFAGLLHDIGEISVNQKVMFKDGKLTPEEFDMIKQHTIYGCRIIAPLPGLNQLALWIRWHHESWNGTGYPDQLKEHEIPVEAQIISIMDSFDTLQNPRQGREPFAAEKVEAILREESGLHFNPDIVDVLIEMMQAKSLVHGKSSSRFQTLKEQYIDTPLSDYSNEYWEGTSMTALYPILRLFARVIDANHKYTRGHSTRVSILSKFLAEQMQLPSEDIMKVEVAGLLHDAGKVSVPTEILDKPGRPDPEEWQIIMGHPKDSFDIMTKISALSDIAEIAANHHERYDGKGYPNKLAGDKIHILSQIISVADTYDAITSSRAYRKGQPPEKAFKIIEECTGTQFGPEVARVFLQSSPKYIYALLDMYDVDQTDPF